jgi:hypothetical protein
MRYRKDPRCRFEFYAWLHGREDAYQPGMIATFFQNFLDAVFFFEEVFLVNVFNFDPMVGGPFLSMFPQLIPEKLRMSGVNHFLFLNKIIVADYPQNVDN